jgi:predicted Zn-dependent peptidase
VAIDYRKPGTTGPVPPGRLVTCVQATTSGPSYGSLTFRVGMADESVPTRGITHLVEHLVMRESFDLDVRSNASVGLTRTTFWAAGDEVEVITFLQRVQRALTNVPVQHLASERDLIAVEEEHHAVSLPSPVQHFGAQRYGVVWFEQQLAHLGPEQVRAWVAERFTAANAVLTLVGVDRGRAGIRLPEGRFFPEPPVHQTNSRPTLHVDPSERTISLTALLPTSWSASVLAAVLDRAVMNRLRHVEHLAYGAGATELRINLDTTMVSITSDCIAGREGDLVDALLDELDRLTRELDDDLVLRAVGRTVADAENTSALTEEALRVLHGRPLPAALGTMEPDLDALTVASLQELLRSFRAACVLRTPVPVQPAGDWQVVGAATGGRWSGRTFSDGARTLTVAGNGLQISTPGFDQQITWSSITAAFVTDDLWTLVSRKGVRVDVRPGEFRGSAELAAELGDRVPTAARLPGPWRKAKG